MLPSIPSDFKIDIQRVLGFSQTDPKFFRKVLSKFEEIRKEVYANEPNVTAYREVVCTDGNFREATFEVVFHEEKLTVESPKELIKRKTKNSERISFDHYALQEAKDDVHTEFFYAAFAKREVLFKDYLCDILTERERDLMLEFYTLRSLSNEDRLKYMLEKTNLASAKGYTDGLEVTKGCEVYTNYQSYGRSNLTEVLVFNFVTREWEHNSGSSDD